MVGPCLLKGPGRRALVEFDPVANRTVRALSVRNTNAFGRGLPNSLAVHPVTGTLFVAWFDQVDSQPDHSGFAEFTQAGALVGRADFGNDFFTPGTAFSPSGTLQMVHAGGPLYEVDPVSRSITATRDVLDLRPGTFVLCALGAA